MGKWSVAHPAKKSVLVTCPQCGTVFETPAWRIAQGKGKFCSPKCRHLASRTAEGIEVDGKWFGKTGTNSYYWHKAPDKRTISLHRYIWEKANGPVPEGFHVHHIDHNPANNKLENLELVDETEHARYHLQQRIANGSLDTSASLEKAREAAKAWHKSEEGRAWHREHARKVADSRTIEKHKCVRCGNEYEAKSGARKKGYCGPNCLAAARRESGVDDETRICVECGAEFRVSRYSRVKSCSRSCGAKQMVKSRTKS